MTFPITLAPAAKMIEYYSVLDASCCLGATPPLASTPTRSYGTYGSVADSDTTDEEMSPTVYGNSSGPSSPTSSIDYNRVVRWLNRLILVIFTTAVATYIPCFGSIISLLGGFTTTILDFVLPPLLHLRIVGFGLVCRESIGSSTGPVVVPLSGPPKGSPYIVHRDLVLLIVGLIVCVVATSISILNIATSTC
jgi:hypothetical protein|mmetsp:Transcript_5630/g.12374  ORF Transcript_5630/g.12374 Transcript_5630/m.12374 type:complete len:193 (+) Transcript_5630:1108-1686(+)